MIAKPNPWDWMGTLQKYGERAEGRDISWEIATGNRKAVEELKKATMKRDKTAYCLVMETGRMFKE